MASNVSILHANAPRQGTAKTDIVSLCWLETWTAASRDTDQHFADQNQVFDLTGSDFPYVMIPEPTVDFYAAWQPVVINAGDGPSEPKVRPISLTLFLHDTAASRQLQGCSGSKQLENVQMDTC